MSTFSRRQFLTAAMGAVGAASLSTVALSATGCAPKGASQESGAEASDAGTEEGATARKAYIDENGVYVPSFLIPPEPYETWDEEVDADIVVVGLGTAGCAAAKAALESGCRVVAIEQNETFNGRSSHLHGVNSPIAKQFCGELSEESKQAAVTKLMQLCMQMPDQTIWQYFTHNSGRITDWFIDVAPNIVVFDGSKTLAEQGLESITEDGTISAYVHNYPFNPECDPDQQDYPQYPGDVILTNGLSDIYQLIVDAVEASDNGECRFSTWGRQLIKDESGRVTGVFAEDVDGNIIRLTAERGVILCCGDCAGNEEMRRYYAKDSMNYSAFMYGSKDALGNPANMGSGIQMGLWAGASIEQGGHVTMTHSFGGALGCDPFLFVNNRGERFMNEDIPGDLMSVKGLQCPDMEMFQIFDAKWPEQIHAFNSNHAILWNYKESLDQVGFSDTTNTCGAISPAQVEQAATYKADTLEELAELMGVPKETFLATVERYNELAHGGVDLDFGKNPERMFPLEQGPFYASYLGQPSAFMMVTGLRSNGKAQVLDENMYPIPGLFCAGNNQGSRYYGTYPTVFMGCSHGMAVTMGYRAVEVALDDELSKVVAPPEKTETGGSDAIPPELEGVEDCEPCHGDEHTPGEENPHGYPAGAKVANAWAKIAG